MAFCAISLWSQNGIPCWEKQLLLYSRDNNGKLIFRKILEAAGNAFQHPKDFTPVCTSEILGLAKMQDDLMIWVLK